MLKTQKNLTTSKLNRIRVVLLKNKRLADELKKNKSVVYKWNNNFKQTFIEILHKIPKILYVDIRQFLNPTKDRN